MKRENELGASKYFANKGLKRTKSALPNIIYKIEITQLKSDANVAYFEPYKFKDLGYMVLSWTNQKADSFGEYSWYWHGFITIDELKRYIGTNQYSKFCQGKREFIIQRRVDGNNTYIQDLAL